MAGVAVLLGAAAAAGATPPHLIVALVDDLGWYNVPWKNPEQRADPFKAFVEEEAVLLDRFYTYKYCSPTRSSLLSGRLPYHVNEKLPGPLNDDVGGIHPDMTLVPAKLKQRGYATAMIGKGHIGARSAAFLPINRGFDYHFGFLGGGEDHNTQAGEGGVDLWRGDGPAYGENGTNSCYLYGRDAVSVIRQHNASQPFFLYLAFQDVHAPYQSLPEYTNNSIPYERRANNGMMNCVCDATMNVTAALKEQGMWDNTLMVFASDNGGPQYWEGNNYPLRGGKWVDFEGGVRVAAFAAGGVVASGLKGTTLGTVFHVADLYRTFCALAGADPEDPVAGLPGVDGLDMSSFLTAVPANATRPDGELVLSSDTLLQGHLKYTVYTEAFYAKQSYCFYEGKPMGCGYWTGPAWPNASAHVPATFDLLECEHGCLFDVDADPEERHDLSQERPGVFAAMQARLAELVKTAYQTQGDFGYTDCVTLEEYAAQHRGFIGPPCKKPH